MVRQGRGDEGRFPASGSLRGTGYLDRGAKVRTLEGGRTELSLYGGRVVRLDPDSILEIPIKYPVETIGDYIRLIKGEFWLSIDKIQNPLMYIETSNAITAVKGTKFEVVVDYTGTTVRVFEGVVEVSDLNRTKNVASEPIRRL